MSSTLVSSIRAAGSDDEDFPSDASVAIDTYVACGSSAAVVQEGPEDNSHFPDATAWPSRQVVSSCPPLEAQLPTDELASPRSAHGAEVLDKISAPKEEVNSIALLKNIVCELYDKHNSAKLSELDGLFRKHAGNERSLYARICKKYSVEPDPRFVPSELPTSAQAAVPDQLPHQQPPLTTSVYVSLFPADTVAPHQRPVQQVLPDKCWVTRAELATGQVREDQTPPQTPLKMVWRQK